MPEFEPDSMSDRFLPHPPEALRYDAVDGDVQEVAGLLAAAVPEGASVLDVGCGTGALAEFIQQVRKARITGIEPSHARVERARDRGLNVIEGLLSPDVAASLPPFDVVLLADVLEHLAQPSIVLQTALACLKPDGLLLLSVPNAAHWSVRMMLLRGSFEYEDSGLLDSTHLRWFTRASLIDWLGRNGLEVMSLKVSLGSNLPAYHRIRWISRMRDERRKSMIRRLVRIRPTLFGSQFVAVACRRGI